MQHAELWAGRPGCLQRLDLYRARGTRSMVRDAPCASLTIERVPHALYPGLSGYFSIGTPTRLPHSVQEPS